jgi:Spy/CpxP family protein refolding chaperone
MKKILATAAVALLCTLGAQAQTDQKATGGTSTHNCLLKADDNTWTTLGLSADQKQKVKDVQVKYKADADKTMDAKSGMDKYDKELQTILTPEQQEKWKQWCSGRTTAPTDKK